ncbi:MAG: type I secretion system permease/ATPase [Halioglobus sp.]
MTTDLKQSPLLKMLAPLRPYIVAAGVFSMFINILMIVPAIYMLQVYDRAVGSQSLSTLSMLTLIMVGLLIAMGGLTWVRSQIMGRASGRLVEILSARVFDSTFRQALFSGGRSSVQPLTDMNGLRAFLFGPGVNAFFDAPWVPIYILIMFAFHAYFGLLAIASVLLLGALTWINQRSTHSVLEEANEEQQQAGFFATSHLRNAEVIESMGMIDDVRDRWLQHYQRGVVLQAGAAEKSGWIASTSSTLRIMLQSLALGLGAYLAINLEISAGMMIAGSILLGRALAPVDQLVGGWKALNQARQQFDRLDTLLRRLPPVAEKMELPAPVGNLSVDSIVVAPPGGRVPVLKGVSFNLQAGTALGVIGPSAAGKSSLARALLGIWPALSGSVRLDAADIYKWDRAELGQYVGYLPQDIELFNGTIAENIARFGKIDEVQVVEAARLAGVHEMILRLPDGYDTVIGVAGGALAGGQRQRIGLARAIYRKPRLVVLDEPNSNLDDVGEAALCKALQSLKAEGITVVVISHRSSILSVVDKVLVLKDGTALDFGPVKEVIEKYKRPTNLRNLPSQVAR